MFNAVSSSLSIVESIIAVPVQIGGGFLELAVLFAILAIVAALLGARGVAGLSMDIAKWLVLLFVVLAIISLLL
jgi:uncharacterized membrane protein YtjA (UPF0391 family)